MRGRHEKAAPYGRPDEDALPALSNAQRSEVARLSDIDQEALPLLQALRS